MSEAARGVGPWSAVVLVVSLVVSGCFADSPGSATPPDSMTSDPAAVSPSPSSDEPLETQSPSPQASPSPPPLTSAALREAVEVAAIRTHLEELQGIADANAGNRAAGSAGYDGSVAYVAERLHAAGYVVDQFAFPFGGTTDVNLLAELPGGSGEVVMLGAHLDSSPHGPGIDDNGSGSMTLLALAELLPSFASPSRSVRFGFWGAEEPGRIGSEAYVASLAPRELGRLSAYLNVDIVGSPNFIRFVYADAAAPPGSEAITQVFAAHFASQGHAWDPIDLSGKSDHAAFSRAGVPTGGLFSGGREPKTDAQAATYGGIAGAPADPCADTACDTIFNLSDTALDQMADALAHALATLVSE